MYSTCAIYVITSSAPSTPRPALSSTGGGGGGGGGKARAHTLCKSGGARAARPGTIPPHARRRWRKKNIRLTSQ
ncbi:hypothetical protein JYU34_006298 [Plutella xylostella]|uniref:Uncharacterized protein n=1 Tax=Plutella xylostella TaxID=51655 RepID=A0ABQ7QRR3_PLUXY|nr:hypothetical protein JYU34_006298 [Plutella xylostella]